MRRAPDGLLLAADVGGTKTRLALAAGGSRDPIWHAEHTAASAEHASFAAIALPFLERAGHPALAGACIAVAGPVVDGSAEVTNLPWTLDARALAVRLDTRVELLNDVEATAFGMLSLEDSVFETLQHGSPPADGGTIAVIAAGTGLGEAVLRFDGARHHPVATEGSHASFAPGSEQEIGLLRHLRDRHGHVSVERVVSGSGIPEIYRYLRGGSGVAEPPALAERLRAGDPAAAITEVALEGGDPVCAATLALFVSCYGAESGDLALRHLALGGVWIGGGIAPKILPALRAPAFLEAFADKGRFRELLRRVPVRVCLDPDTALQGAARYGLRGLSPRAAGGTTSGA